MLPHRSPDLLSRNRHTTLLQILLHLPGSRHDLLHHAAPVLFRALEYDLHLPKSFADHVDLEALH